MQCHECAGIGVERMAVSVCRCRVRLGKDHLVAAFCCATVPQYGCDHHPERPFVPRTRAPRPTAGRPVA